MYVFLVIALCFGLAWIIGRSNKGKNQEESIVGMDATQVNSSVSITEQSSVENKTKIGWMPAVSIIANVAFSLIFLYLFVLSKEIIMRLSFQGSDFGTVIFVCVILYAAVLITFFRTGSLAFLITFFMSLYLLFQFFIVHTAQNIIDKTYSTMELVHYSQFGEFGTKMFASVFILNIMNIICLFFIRSLRKLRGSRKSSLIKEVGG